MIFLNEANSVKELIWTEMLRLRKTIPGRDKSMGPLILLVTLAALAYIISLHLRRQRTQTPGPLPPPLTSFPSLSMLFVWLIFGGGGGTLFFYCQFSSICSRTITENCMETVKSRTTRVGRHWPVRTPPSRRIGRSLPRRIQSAVWKCM